MPGWSEDARRLGLAGSCGPPSLMLPLFVRQGISLVIRRSEITTSCGIGQRRRYLVDGGRVIRAGGDPAGLNPVRSMF
jgi:hypothetical protein